MRSLGCEAAPECPPTPADGLLSCFNLARMKRRSRDIQNHLYWTDGLEKVMKPSDIPDIKADGHGDIEAFEADSQGLGAGLEVSPLVEHPVVRQQRLAGRPRNSA